MKFNNGKKIRTTREIIYFNQNNKNKNKNLEFYLTLQFLFLFVSF